MGGHVFEVMDQLRQVFDGVDVMVRRWRDEAHTGHAVAQFTDVLGDFAPRQLTAFARLGALGHFDLNLVGTVQVLGGHTKTPGCDLLDARTKRIPVEKRHVHFDLLISDHTFEGLALFDRDAFELLAIACGILTALARVAFAANSVHGHGQGGMGFGGDGTQRHGARGKAFDDFTCTLDTLQGNGLGRVDLELKQTSECHVATALVVDQLGILFVRVETAVSRAVLQLGNHIGRPHVLLAPGAPGVLAPRIEHVGEHRIFGVSQAVGANGLFSNRKDANALHPGGRSSEILLHSLGVNADGFKQLSAAVTHVGGDAHFGHDLGESLADGLHVVVNGFVGREVARQVLVNGLQGLHGQVRVHRLGAVTRQHGEVVNFACRAGLHHQAR